MTKRSGKERKSRRRARELAETRYMNLLNGEDYYSNSEQDLALVRKSIRWNTGSLELTLPPEKIREEIRNGRLSPKTVAILVTLNHMQNEDANVALAAVRCLLAMESQNQKDKEIVEKTSPKEAPVPVQILNQNIQNNVTVQDVVSELSKDLNYVDFLRTQVIEEERHDATSN